MISFNRTHRDQNLMGYDPRILWVTASKVALPFMGKVAFAKDVTD